MVYALYVLGWNTFESGKLMSNNILFQSIVNCFNFPIQRKVQQISQNIVFLWQMYISLYVYDYGILLHLRKRLALSL